MNNVESGLVGDSILSRAAYGPGYGYGQGRDFASDSSNAIRIQSNEKISSLGHASLSQQISDNADRNRDLQQFGQAGQASVALNDKITDQTRFFSAEINLIAREQAQNARAAAECCCEAKLLAAQNQAKTDAGLATILANQACDTRVSDAVANAHQNAKLDALLADNGRRGH